MRPARPIATARLAASFPAAASRSPLQRGIGWPRSSIWPAFSPPSAAPAASRSSVPRCGSRCSPCRLRRSLPRRNGSHVGLGWDSVTEEPRGIEFHKSGSAAGVRTYIEHRADGIDWVLLLNSDGQVQDQPPAAGEIIDKIRQAIDATGDWPDRNLFESPAGCSAQRQKSAGSVVVVGLATR